MASTNLEIVISAKDRASSVLKKIGGGISTLAKFGAAGAVAGIGALGAGLAAAAIPGLKFNNTMEQVSAQLNAFTKDADKTQALLDMIRQRAAATPFSFEEMAKATASLFPAAKQSGKSIEELISLAEILAASNPAEGLEGAAFSLREALSGDFTSIIERFNLPRSAINRLKEEGVPALAIVSQAMSELGLDAELVGNLADTAEGRWSTFKDTLTGISASFSAQLFENLSERLGGANDVLSKFAPMLEGIAAELGHFATEFVMSLIPGEETLNRLITGVIPGLGLMFKNLFSGEILNAALNFVSVLANLGVPPHVIAGMNDFLLGTGALWEEFTTRLQEVWPQVEMVIADSMTRIQEALGIEGEVDAVGIALWLVESALDGIVLAAQSLGIISSFFADAVEIAVRLTDQVNTIIDLLSNLSIPQAIGGITQGLTGSAGAGAFAENLAGGGGVQALVPALSASSSPFGLGGITINMDGQQVGAITAGHQGNTSRQVRGVGGPATQ